MGAELAPKEIKDSVPQEEVIESSELSLDQASGIFVSYEDGTILLPSDQTQLASIIAALKESKSTWKKIAEVPAPAM